MRPFPVWRRRYPNDMAVARQSEVDQSVNGGGRDLYGAAGVPGRLTSPFKAWRNPLDFCRLFVWFCRWFMLCRAPVVTLAIALTALPVATQAYDIKPKTPESAFSGKLHPDILGISADSSADAARAILEAFFKGRANATKDIPQPKFGNTAISFIAALN